MNALLTNVSRVALAAMHLVIVCVVSSCALQAAKPPFVQLFHDEAEKRVRVEVGGDFFTAYLYEHPLLNKPVLFPVVSAAGLTVTRGYPLDTRPGERVDHTHHHGIWFNHGDVNGIDFWNAGRTPPKPNVRYGRIQHRAIEVMTSGDKGTLVVAKEWLSDTDELILTEQTTYVFRGDQHRRLITHTTRLSAVSDNVVFTDSKEGAFAIRVARELEIASEKASILTDETLHAMPQAMVDNRGVSGHYRNSNGLEGYPAVWGKRARWMQLSGVIETTPINVIMFDAPSNINHPPHWMARDYGLFAVNPLGSSVYTKGAEVLNARVKKSQTKTFKNEIIISDSINPDAATIEAWYDVFVTSH